MIYIYRFKTEEYSYTVVNEFNVIPDSILSMLHINFGLFLNYLEWSHCLTCSKESWYSDHSCKGKGRGKGRGRVSSHPPSTSPSKEAKIEALTL